MSKLFGLEMDEETRCLHYHGDLDIVALKCLAAMTITLEGNDVLADHAFQPYPCDRLKDKVVLCGGCRAELTISQY